MQNFSSLEWSGPDLKNIIWKIDSAESEVVKENKNHKILIYEDEGMKLGGCLGNINTNLYAKSGLSRMNRTGVVNFWLLSKKVDCRGWHFWWKFEKFTTRSVFKIKGWNLQHISTPITAIIPGHFNPSPPIWPELFVKRCFLGTPSTPVRDHFERMGWPQKWTNFDEIDDMDREKHGESNKFRRNLIRWIV